MKELEPKTRNLIYRPRTLADIQKHLQIHGLGDAIYQAHKRDAAALLAYLRSNLPLSHLEEHRCMLADLIERYIQRKAHGQRGKAVPTAKGDMQARFIAICRRRLKASRMQNGGKLPRGEIKKIMTAVGTQIAEGGDFGDLNWDAAYQSLLKQH